MKLAEMTTFEVDRLPRDMVVITPVAALEQHSRHLPVFTDSIIAGAVSEAVEARLPKDVLLLPVQWAGASAHHLGFAGTVTLSVDTHTDVIEQMLRSLLAHGFANHLVLNGHGGNVDTMHMALRRLSEAYPKAHLSAACYWDIAAGAIAGILKGPKKDVGHACEMETSLVMAIRPDLVRQKEIRDDPPRDDDRLKGVYIPLDMKAHTAQGEIGYASHATAATGRKLLDAIVAEVTTTVAALRKGATRGGLNHEGTKTRSRKKKSRRESNEPF